MLSIENETPNTTNRLSDINSKISPKFLNVSKSNTDNLTPNYSINQNQDELSKSDLEQNENESNSNFKNEIAELDKLIDQKNEYKKFYSHSMKINYVPLSSKTKKQKYDDINKYSSDRFKKYNILFDQIKEQILDIDESYKNLIESSKKASSTKYNSCKIINEILMDDLGSISQYRKTDFDTKGEFPTINEDIKEENDSIFESENKSNISNNENDNDKQTKENELKINESKELFKKRVNTDIEINKKINLKQKNKKPYKFNKKTKNGNKKENNNQKENNEVKLNNENKEHKKNVNISSNPGQKEIKGCNKVLENSYKIKNTSEKVEIKKIPDNEIIGPLIFNYNDINEKNKEKKIVCDEILKERPAPKNLKTNHSTIITQTQSQKQMLRNNASYRTSKTSHFFYDNETSKCKCANNCIIL